MVALSLIFAPSFAEQSSDRPPLLAPGGSCFVLPPLRWRAPGEGLVATRRGRDIRVQRAPVAKLFGWFGNEEDKDKARSNLPSAQRLKKAMSQVANFRSKPRPSSPRAPTASAVRRHPCSSNDSFSRRPCASLPGPWTSKYTFAKTPCSIHKCALLVLPAGGWGGWAERGGENGSGARTTARDANAGPGLP